ncbi:hypothetical protein FORC065_1831 [Yersinia enterocolitica]|nr:hypothetical protein FORC065_1831 [Yersinia enterocolitica]
MTDYIEAYREYRQVKATISMNGKAASYDWVPRSASGPREIIYNILLNEHHRELSNAINHFARLINKLEAWSIVIENKAEQEKFDLIIEFIDEVATIALNLPYAIRSRFIVSITKLSHQANLIKNESCNDELPSDDKMTICHVGIHGKGWWVMKKLIPTLEKISNNEYKNETDDFRNKYNHRYSPRIEIGIYDLVKREINGEGQVIYSLGSTPPLKLKNIIVTLKKQHECCLKVYELYQNLIAEQLESFDKL